MTPSRRGRRAPDPLTARRHTARNHPRGAPGRAAPARPGRPARRASGCGGQSRGGAAHGRRQAHPAPGHGRREPRPLGFDVSTTIARDAPELLPAIPAERIAELQRRADVEAGTRDVDARKAAAIREFRERTRVYDLDPYGFGPERRRLEKLESERPPGSRDAPEVQIGTESVRADEVRGASLLFNSAEARFRDDLRARLVASPVRVRVSKDWGVTLIWQNVGLPHTKGRVTFSDLLKVDEFSESYAREVGAKVEELETYRETLTEVGRRLRGRQPSAARR